LLELQAAGYKFGVQFGVIRVVQVHVRWKERAFDIL